MAATHVPFEKERAPTLAGQASTLMRESTLSRTTRADSQIVKTLGRNGCAQVALTPAGDKPAQLLRETTHGRDTSSVTGSRVVAPGVLFDWLKNTLESLF